MKIQYIIAIMAALLISQVTSRADWLYYNDYGWQANFTPGTYTLDANNLVVSGKLVTDQHVHYNFTDTALIKAGTTVTFKHYKARIAGDVTNGYLRTGTLSGTQSLNYGSFSPATFKDGTLATFYWDYIVTGTLSGDQFLLYGQEFTSGTDSHTVKLKSDTVVNFAYTAGQAGNQYVLNGTLANVNQSILYNSYGNFYHRSVTLQGGTPVSFYSGNTIPYGPWDGKLDRGTAYGTQTVAYGTNSDGSFRTVNVAGEMSFFYAGYAVRTDGFLVKGKLVGTNTVEWKTSTGTMPWTYYALGGGYSWVLHFSSEYNGCVIVNESTL